MDTNEAYDISKILIPSRRQLQLNQRGQVHDLVVFNGLTHSSGVRKSDRSGFSAPRESAGNQDVQGDIVTAIDEPSWAPWQSLIVLGHEPLAKCIEPFGSEQEVHIVRGAPMP